MMKKFLLTSLFLCGAISFSQPVLAECSQPRKNQKIHIKEIDGKIQVENKIASERCTVENNQSNDENTGSDVVWIFHGLNCQPGECRIEIEGKPRLSERAFKCDLGNPDRRRCRLKVNRLKKFCDNRGADPDACEFTYMIMVRDQKIDPSIIIRPRPSSVD